STSRAALWTGRVLTGLSSLFLLVDAGMKLVGSPVVAEASVRLGLPVEIGPAIGAILLACVVLYLVPRTAVLGAVLLTGYFGGAILTHLRVGDPLFTHTLFPIYFGVFVWGGLFLRDARVRALFGPVR
ncbi:MAG: DoxX family protein, partial [Sandaracinaceae bacterium]